MPVRHGNRVSTDDLDNSLIDVHVAYRRPPRRSVLLTLTEGRIYKILDYDIWTETVLVTDNRGNQRWYSYQNFVYCNRGLKSQSSGFKKFQERIRTHAAD